MTEHVVVAKRVYYLNAAALMALLALTVVLGQFDFGPLSVAIALAIAVAKAALVGLLFMHVRFGPPLLRVFSVAGLVWLAILIGLVLADVLTRGWLEPIARGPG